MQLPSSFPPTSVLEKLQLTHGLLAEILGRAPQLYDLDLDTTLLLLALAIKRAQRSPRLRAPLLATRLIAIPMTCLSDHP